MKWKVDYKKGRSPMATQAEAMHRDLFFLRYFGESLQVFVFFVAAVEDALPVDAASYDVMHNVFYYESG